MAKKKYKTIGLPNDRRGVLDFGDDSLTLFCQNAYLIPPALTWNAVFWSCIRCRERAQDLASIAKPHDIICLQEVWGTSLDALKDGVSDTHDLLEEGEPCCASTAISEIVDPVRLYMQKTGGLWFAWKRDLLDFSRCFRRSFRSHVPLSNQNVTCVELDADSFFPGKKLIIFNTHFTLLGSRQKLENIQTLKDFVREQIWEILIEKGGDPNFLLDFGVVLVGDFNIDKKLVPNLYKRLLSLDGCAYLRDLYTRKENPLHPHCCPYTVEAGNSKTFSGNSLFPWNTSGRVDYVLALDELTFSVPWMKAYTEKNETPVNIRRKVEKRGSVLTVRLGRLNCNGLEVVKQPWGEEVSDHWGLSCALSFDLEGLPEYHRRGERRSDTFTSTTDFTYDEEERKSVKRDGPQGGRRFWHRRRPSADEGSGSSGSWIRRQYSDSPKEKSGTSSGRERSDASGGSGKQTPSDASGGSGKQTPSDASGGSKHVEIDGSRSRLDSN